MRGRRGSVPAMDRRSVNIQIAGQSYRVVTSAADAELQRLVGAVNSKLSEVSPRNGSPPPQALLLAAIALAHDLEEERRKREALEWKASDLMRRMLAQIDDALEGDG